MKYLNSHLLFIIFLFTSFKSPEKTLCNCPSTETLLETSKKSNLVCVGKVKSYTHYKYIQNQRVPVGMDVEVLEILKGNTLGKTIRIWGENGKLCRYYLSNFPLNKTYTFVLEKGNPKSGNVGEKISDFALSDCGENVAPTDFKTKMIIYGNGQNRQQISFDDIKSYWLQ